MSTIDETNNSSTNSIITEINNGPIADDDFSEQSSVANSVNDDLFETQTVRGSTINGDDAIQELDSEVRRKKIGLLEFSLK